MMRQFSLLLIPSALARIGAANLGGPRSTVRAESSPQTGFSPKPTAKAQLGQQANNIFERQAYAETCDYVGEVPVTCAAGLQCAVDTMYNAGGCCAGGACYLPTTCLNADAAEYDCDANCLSNPRNLFCTELNYPFCQGLIFNYATGPYTGYLCAAYTERMVYTVTPNGAITPEVIVYHTSAAPQSQQAAGTVTAYPSSGGNSGDGNDNNINGNNKYQYNGNITIVNPKSTAVRTVGSKTTLLRWLSQSGAFAVIITLAF